MESKREHASTGAATGQRGEPRLVWRELPRPQRLRIGGCAAYAAVLTWLCIRRLTRLMLYAAYRDLHSHILLVPLVAGYLLYIQRGSVLAFGSRSIVGTTLTGGIGLAALAAGIGWRGGVTLNDELALMALVV